MAWRWWKATQTLWENSEGHISSQSDIINSLNTYRAGTDLCFRSEMGKVTDMTQVELRKPDVITALSSWTISSWSSVVRIRTGYNLSTIFCCHWMKKTSLVFIFIPRGSGKQSRHWRWPVDECQDTHILLLSLQTCFKLWENIQFGL